MVTRDGATIPRPSSRPLNVGIRVAALSALLDDAPAMEAGAVAAGITVGQLRRALARIATSA